MRQRTDVYSMSESELDSGLHVITPKQTKMFMTLAVQHGFEKNPNKMIMTR